MTDELLFEYPVRCHCGTVRGRFKCKKENGKVIAWDCNCSDCFMRKNVHVIIPKQNLSLTMDVPLEDATTLYLWGTKTAIRRFCKTCGVLPWYNPRSNHRDGVAITTQCVDWTDGQSKESPELEIRKFDGQNWEDYIKKIGVAITDQSKG